MPYIILKRDDIVTGTLQVLDLCPNESQRNLIYTPPGQTKYVDPVQNGSLTLVGAGPINVRGDTRGLSAWFVTNVNDGTGTFASGTFTVTGFPATPGDTFTVDGQLYTGAAVPRTPGSNDWDTSLGSVGALATEMAAAINDPLNGSPPGTVTDLVTAVPVAAVVTVTADVVGIAGNSIVLSDASTVVTTVVMSGGADADSLTAAEAETDADDVLGLLAFGDLTTAAGVLTLGAINGALTTGTITAAQLSDVLDILAGRVFLVPDGTQVDSDGTTFLVDPPVGSANGPRFIAGSLRDIYDTSAFTLSVNTGQLEKLLDPTYALFGVGGTQGEAVAVYNDDGTLF